MSNLFRTCPSCVEQHGWPKGFNPTRQDRKDFKQWKETRELSIEVLSVERNQ